MRKKFLNQAVLSAVRHNSKSKIRPPPPASSPDVIRVTNNIAHLGRPKEGPKPRQLLSLPPFPGHPLPGRKSTSAEHVTAISWLKYYFDDIPPPLIQSHFNKCLRFDVIPSGTLYPNADEIEYLRRLVKYKARFLLASDSAILVLNKPPKLPVKGNLSVHNSMDALAAAALTYDYEEGPKLVHRLDRESSGLLLMGRSRESISYLQWLFNEGRKAESLSKDWNDACEAMYQRYWALVIGLPKQKEGLICAPLTKVLLNDGKTERVILAHNSGLEAAQEAITEYRVLGPTINGCSWIELRPHTRRKHQLRVHCAEALGTPIVGDYKYGWFVHKRWKQMPRVDVEPRTGDPYKLRRPEGLDVQKGSVLSKVPLLHLHCREMVLPNIAKFIELHKQQLGGYRVNPEHDSKPDVLRFVAPMPSHMKISWNLMSSYLV
ncbi:RNA pseudouridine synthase 3, mitochondrial [Sesamum angolense]|uniref:RNA pseudouridine synthase 3, mitochondrial n=1 Tax=Sesamum angolense TaxID=2727404 RepID=A0AAE2BJI7_9LAMI|nr:RNA pseudouridine synthase 3, mitochondrial [Sesamum angolense]